MRRENIIVSIPGVMAIFLGLIITIPFLYLKETAQDLNDILDLYVTIMIFVGMITFFIGGFIFTASHLLNFRINKLEKRLDDLSNQVEELSEKKKD